MLNVHRAWQMLRCEKADPNADGIYRTLAWTSSHLPGLAMYTEHDWTADTNADGIYRM